MKQEHKWFLINFVQKAQIRIYRVMKALMGERAAKKAASLYRTVVVNIRGLSRNTSKKDYARLHELGSGKKALRLHFGCGSLIYRGWVNIDISRHKKVWWNFFKEVSEAPADIRGTEDDFFRIDFSEGPLPLPNDSVDVIYDEDFIEHITQRDTFLFLAETHRVLKPGGIHHISTPDLHGIMERWSDFSKGYSGVFVREWDKHEHLNILTPDYLREIAALIGYSDISFTTLNKSRATLLPPETRPGRYRTLKEQIFCDLTK